MRVAHAADAPPRMPADPYLTRQHLYDPWRGYV